MAPVGVEMCSSARMETQMIAVPAARSPTLTSESCERNGSSRQEHERNGKPSQAKRPGKTGLDSSSEYPGGGGCEDADEGEQSQGQERYPV